MFPKLTHKKFASISAVDLKTMTKTTKNLMVGEEKKRVSTITFYWMLLGFIVLCFHLVVKCGWRSLCRGGGKVLKGFTACSFCLKG